MKPLIHAALVGLCLGVAPAGAADHAAPAQGVETASVLTQLRGALLPGVPRRGADGALRFAAPAAQGRAFRNLYEPERPRLPGADTGSLAAEKPAPNLLRLRF